MESSEVEIAGHTYSHLQQLFGEILKENLVIDDAPLPTLFDIAGFPHYEDVSSNWYAFFLAPDEAHGLKELFLYSLIELINKKGYPAFNMDTCSVEREYQSAKGGFIDLLIYEKGTNEDFVSAIVLENKIGADLYNDIDDYFDSIKVDQHENKIGVVLTLYPLDVSKYTKKPFVSITHKEWLDAVKFNLGDYIIAGNEKYLIHLKDFIQNFETMTTTKEAPESFKFYFDNGEKIQELIDLKAGAEKYIVDKLSNALNKSKWERNRVNATTISLTYPDTPFVCYVYYDEVFNAHLYWLEMWIRGNEGVSKWNTLEVSELKDKYKGMEVFEPNPKNTEWSKISNIEYTGLTSGDVENFGEHVVNNLEADYAGFLNNVRSKLT